MKKQILVVFSIVIALSLAAIAKSKEFHAQVSDVRICSVSFDSEKEKLVSASMIKTKLEEKYQIADQDLRFRKIPNPLKSEGTYYVEFNDKDGLFHTTKIKATVSFTDKTGPNITQLTKTICYGSNLKSEMLFKAEDRHDGLESADKIHIHNLNTNRLGKNVVEVEAFDKAGNETKREFELTVVDKQSPEIKNIEDTTLSIDQAALFQPLQGVKGQDNVDGDISDEIQASLATVPRTPGIYSINYRLKDHVGNETRAVRKVTVVENENKSEPKTPAVSISSEQNKEAKNQVVDDSAIPQEEITSKNFEKTVNATVSFLGVTIPYSHTNGAGSAPTAGCGTWTGTGAVDDNAPTHFIGHNPGDFSPVMNITVGTPITVVDNQGHSKIYTVYEVLNVNDNGMNADNPTDDTWPRVIDDGGERISLQTCITDSVNRIVLAR